MTQNIVITIVLILLQFGTITGVGTTTTLTTKQLMLKIYKNKQTLITGPH